MDVPRKSKERNFPQLQLNEAANNPVLIIQSPKTPTLSRKQKAASLDSHETASECVTSGGAASFVECCRRDVYSVPNTPKKHQKTPETSVTREFTQKLTLTGTNLRRYASNTSISGSQTLKTLPEVMTLHEFHANRSEPVRIKAKGLLERRGSNASLTIDLGSATSVHEARPSAPSVHEAPNVHEARPNVPSSLNATKSASQLNLSSYGVERCACPRKMNEKCANCTIYESVPATKPHKMAAAAAAHDLCKCNLKFLPRYYVERHCVCNTKFRRKSLSNENLYVPPCNFCHFGSKDCFVGRACNKGTRKALYPRQTYIETSQLLSEDFKLHLQNVQYLQTAGCVLSVAELKSCCQMEKIPRLHQEFWEVPLNLQEKCLVSGSQSRNRYKGVLPNEHSRVLLPAAQSYIHANYIKGPDYTETAYIATQGPMAHTCEDFWTMVWANNVHRIVMLTALVERGRNKCELYFPLGEQGEAPGALYSDGTSTLGLCEAGAKLFHHPQYSYDEDAAATLDVEQTNHQKWGPFHINYVSKEYLGKCIVRKLEVRQDGGERRTVHHYWYPNWADHKLANPEQVLRIALHVLDAASAICASASATTANTNSGGKFKGSAFDFDHLCDYSGKCAGADGATAATPILVHCSAGIGRTGCFLAILNGIQQLRTNFNVDILAIVCSLRLNRGGMVQTAEQYELIHRVLSLYADTM